MQVQQVHAVTAASSCLGLILKLILQAQVDSYHTFCICTKMGVKSV